MTDDLSGLPSEESGALQRPIRWGLVVYGVFLAILLTYMGVGTVVNGVTTYRTSRADLGWDLIASAPLVVVVTLVWAVARR